ncbi:hypothetical protein K504DRAFT_507894 [Pleomassaria siparia CBS 279.74]|uniref:Uncharacterized protein n=1 Tax=Pleomassaria siparia CBS 279.74 TaxID=1314801 RepID=A0A6G1JSU1_9PLEO|nr:hypothetical protein K504DRAFT_507894 [Pleomassaria siparia CBS 279.74]
MQLRVTEQASEFIGLGSSPDAESNTAMHLVVVCPTEQDRYSPFTPALKLERITSFHGQRHNYADYDYDDYDYDDYDYDDDDDDDDNAA